MMRKVIISGAAGFIGSAVVNRMLKNNIEVYSIVKPGTGNSTIKENLFHKNQQLIECDLSNIASLEELITDRDFDVFYQFAWDGLDNTSLLDYEKQLGNVKWMMDSITVASRLGCKKFIGAGTITQYELLTEEGRRYQGDKHRYFRTAQMACQYMGQSVASDNNIVFIWPIVTNVYGEGELSPRFINTLIRNLVAGKKQVTSEGKQLYDFVHIEDAARAFFLIGKNGKAGSEYIIGSGQARPLRDFLVILKEKVAPDVDLKIGGLIYQGIYLNNSAFDITHLSSDTGYSARVSFEEGIKRTCDWIKKDMEEKN